MKTGRSNHLASLTRSSCSNFLNITGEEMQSCFILFVVDDLIRFGSDMVRTTLAAHT